MSPISSLHVNLSPFCVIVAFKSLRYLDIIWNCFAVTPFVYRWHISGIYICSCRYDRSLLTVSTVPTHRSKWRINPFANWTLPPLLCESFKFHVHVLPHLIRHFNFFTMQFFFFQSFINSFTIFPSLDAFRMKRPYALPSGKGKKRSIGYLFFVIDSRHTS